MAALTISDRQVGSHGSLKRETGKFTSDGTGDYEIVTKVGRIIWFTVQEIASGAVNDGLVYWNSSDTGTTVANGTVHIESDMSNNAAYIYEAIGYG